VVDVDQDGKEDIVATTGGTGLRIFYGDGKGGFPTVGGAPGGLRGHDDLKVGDVTGDGLDDIVATSAWSFEFSVFPLVPGGGIAPRQDYPIPETYNQVFATAVGDFDADGRKEVMLANQAN